MTNYEVFYSNEFICLSSRQSFKLFCTYVVILYKFSFVDGRVELFFNSDRNVRIHMNSRKYSRRQQCAVPAASVLWRSVKCVQNLLGKSEEEDRQLGLGFVLGERGLKLLEMGRAVVRTVMNFGLHKMRSSEELLLC